MFIDTEIKIPKGLPSSLVENMEEIQRYYDDGNEMMFDCAVEGLEGRIKNYVLCGKLSEKDARTLFHRYGNMI